eukprot:gb/GECH01000142.1/.p1 GENE.gb/GECH01000142.1/~~gb/GECH01000142.1/.p1  ORF type:complete len:610 (+),score=164.36 gb/GECH01000142.1/:1-1830(+)
MSGINPRTWFQKPKGSRDPSMNPKTSHLIHKASARLSLKPQPRIETETTLYRDEDGRDYWIPSGPLRGEWEAGEYPMWYKENVDQVRAAQPEMKSFREMEKNAPFAGFFLSGASPELVTSSVQAAFEQRSEDIQQVIDQLNLHSRKDASLDEVARVLSAFSDALSAANQYFGEHTSHLSLLVNPQVNQDLSAEHVEELASTYRKAFESSAGSIDIASSITSTIQSKLDDGNQKNDQKNISAKKQRTLRKAMKLIEEYRKYLDFEQFYQNMTELDKHANVVMKYIAQKPKAYKSAIEHREAGVLPPQKLNAFNEQHQNVDATFAFWHQVGMRSEYDSLNGHKLDTILKRDQEFDKFKEQEMGKDAEPKGWNSFAKYYAKQQQVSESEKELHEALDKQIDEAISKTIDYDQHKRPIPSIYPQGEPSFSIESKFAQPGARVPLGRHKIVLETYLYEWGFSQPALKRLLTLCEGRINKSNGKLKIPCALFPDKQSNTNYAIKLLYSLVHEACKADESEKYHILDDAPRKPTPVESLKQKLGDYVQEDQDSLTLFEKWKNSELRRGETSGEQDSSEIEEQQFLSDERLGLFGDSVVVDDEVEEEIETDEDFWNW